MEDLISAGTVQSHLHLKRFHLLPIQHGNFSVLFVVRHSLYCRLSKQLEKSFDGSFHLDIKCQINIAVWTHKTMYVLYPQDFHIHLTTVKVEKERKEPVQPISTHASRTSTKCMLWDGVGVDEGPGERVLGWTVLSYGPYPCYVTDHLFDIGHAFQILQVSVSPFAKWK